MFNHLTSMFGCFTLCLAREKSPEMVDEDSLGNDLFKDNYSYVFGRLPLNIMDKEFKKNLKKEKFTGLVKQISKESRNIDKLKKDKKVAKTPEEKEKIDNYINTIVQKRDMILNSITKDKAESATLAQQTKAFRVLSDKTDVKGSDSEEQKPETPLIGNINILNLSKEDLLEFLAKKSQSFEKK